MADAPPSLCQVTGPQRQRTEGKSQSLCSLNEKVPLYGWRKNLEGEEQVSLLIKREALQRAMTLMTHLQLNAQRSISQPAIQGQRGAGNDNVAAIFLSFSCNF
ncbi:unnamed protein product [Leuciscus chuanchicus]